MVIAAPFAKDYKSQAILKKYFPNLTLPIIENAKIFFKNKNFVDLHIEPVGQYVFEGYDKWVNQTKTDNVKKYNWKKAYNENLIDYYVISGYKPVELIQT